MLSLRGFVGNIFRKPADPAISRQRNGYCPCCRSKTRFVAYNPWLRDYYACAKCGSIPRQRHVIAVLDARMPGWENKLIHESSPSNDFISRHAVNYSSSQYLPDVPFGTERDGVRSENIEALTFADESIDVFITQDVMEHVFNPAEALREIHRVLRPGGAHVFTAPTHVDLPTSICRARLADDGTVEHLLPESYHGNPVGDGRALVTWDYGQDTQQLFERWVGTPVEVYDRPNPKQGIEAAFLRVYVIRKP